MRQGRRVPAESLEAAGEVGRQSGAHLEAPGGEPDRGLDKLPPGELSEALMRELEAGYGAGDTDSEMAEVMSSGIVFSILVEEHVRARGRGRALAEIEGSRRPITEHHDHEAAAAKVSRGGMGYGEREGGGDRGIDGVSSFAQDRETCLRGVELLADHQTVFNPVGGCLPPVLPGAGRAGEQQEKGCQVEGHFHGSVRGCGGGEPAHLRIRLQEIADDFS